MSKISIDKLDKFIRTNIKFISDNMYTNDFEQTYNTVKDFIFDNLYIVVIFYLLILPYLFRQQGKIKKFNYWMILAIIGLFIFSYVFKISIFMSLYIYILSISSTITEWHILNIVIADIVGNSFKSFPINPDFYISNSFYKSLLKPISIKSIF